METALLSNVAAAAGNAGATTRKLGGVQTWISTNVSAGAGGSGAGGGAIRTDGTQRAFTEGSFKRSSSSKIVSIQVETQI